MRRAWASFKRVARVIGNFNARVILTILYAVLITPIGLVVRGVSDPLKARPQTPNSVPPAAPDPTSVDASNATSAAASYWLPHAKVTDTVDEARRQF